MCIVDQPVEDGVCKSRLIDDIVPGVHGQLAGDHGGSGLIPVFDDLHQVAALRCGQPIRPPIVQDQHVSLGQLPEQAGKASVAMSEFQLGEHARDALIDDRFAIAAGFVTQGAGQPGFTDTARAGDQQVLSTVDPLPLRKPGNLFLLDVPRVLVVDVLNGGPEFEACLADQTILTSNTSSISITRLASRTDRPERFMGFHFMNPVPVMQLVELIRGIATDDATFKACLGVVETLGKTAASAEDFPAFIVNRILMPMINEAVYTLYEGVGSVASIDSALRCGALIALRIHGAGAGRQSNSSVTSVPPSTSRRR